MLTTMTRWVTRLALVCFLLPVSAVLAAPAGSPPVPPASFPEDVTEAINEAGGPDFSDFMRFEKLDKEGGRTYVAGLDANGNPVNEGGTHIIRVYLSYFSGGDSGSGWFCSIEIVDAKGEITNAADSSPNSDYLLSLQNTRSNYENDPDWNEQFERELPRTKKAAIKEAFLRLNQGLKGKVRLVMQRGKNGEGLRVGGRSRNGPN